MWVRAFYFSNVTMITVGYGDVLPVTNLEMLFCVFNMMISCAVFGKNIFNNNSKIISIKILFLSLFLNDRF